MATRTADGGPWRRGFPPAGSQALIAADWDRPTFGEFVALVEHQFGLGDEAAGLLAAGIGRDEALSPGAIRRLCGQLGVPPEDFGVEP